MTEQRMGGAHYMEVTCPDCKRLWAMPLPPGIPVCTDCQVEELFNNNNSAATSRELRENKEKEKN